MAFKRNNKHTCGRYATRPNEVNPDDEFEEEDLSLQTQIDNLRVKISLKKRYNKALLEEVNESQAGAIMMIDDLRAENESLRVEKNEAMDHGKASAVKALRNHRDFLLALRGKEPWQVLEWLDDQIGDLRRKLDSKVYNLGLIKKRLYEAERMVEEIEMYPIPGSSPWEQEFIQEFTRLTVAIAHRQGLRDCARIMHSKYTEILYALRGQKDTWPYAVLKLEKNYKELKRELDGLLRMLTDAIRMKKNTEYRLKLTEKEYHENKKARQKRLRKMRKLCEIELKKNAALFARNTKKPTDYDEFSNEEVVVEKKDEPPTLLSIYRSKQKQFREYEEKAARIVEVMHVPDLRHCPKRIQAVRNLHDMLSVELADKKKTVQLLRKEKRYLLLVRNYLHYTGFLKEQTFDKGMIEWKKKKQDVQKELGIYEIKLNRTGKFAAQFHPAITGIIEILYEGKKVRKLPKNYVVLAKVAIDRIRKLVASVEDLRSKFDPKKKPERNYAAMLKQDTKDKDCRKGQAYNQHSSDSEDDDEDEGLSMGVGADKVLDRDEIKAGSQRVYNRGLLEAKSREAKALKASRIHPTRSQH